MSDWAYIGGIVWTACGLGIGESEKMVIQVDVGVDGVVDVGNWLLCMVSLA